MNANCSGSGFWLLCTRLGFGVLGRGNSGCSALGIVGAVLRNAVCGVGVRQGQVGEEFGRGKVLCRGWLCLCVRVGLEEGFRWEVSVVSVGWERE